MNGFISHISSSPDLYPRYIRWQQIPVVWSRGKGNAGVGEVVKPPKPTLPGMAAFAEALDKAACFQTIGYHAVNDVYIRLSQTRHMLRAEAVVELWYMQGDSLKHVQGEGATYREAYQRAQRLQRQVANYGSVTAAVQHGRAEASKPKPKIKETSDKQPDFVTA